MVMGLKLKLVIVLHTSQENGMCHQYLNLLRMRFAFLNPKKGISPRNLLFSKRFKAKTFHYCSSSTKGNRHLTYLIASYSFCLIEFSKTGAYLKCHQRGTYQLLMSDDNDQLISHVKKSLAGRLPLDESSGNF